MFTVNKNMPIKANKENTMAIIRSDCFLDDCQIIPAKKERMMLRNYQTDQRRSAISLDPRQ